LPTGVDHGTWSGCLGRWGGGCRVSAAGLAGAGRGRHDGGVIRELARVVPTPPGKPVREEAARDQERARRLALRPGSWNRQEAAAMRAAFDAAAAGWEDSRGGYRRPVLADALARGGPFLSGRAVEIASGTGLLTPLIAQLWPGVAAVDLSGGMLAYSAASCRIQADAARLPLADGCAAAVVIGDGPLFAAEAARVMAAGAVLVWSNALGDGAPFFVPVEVLTGVMTEAAGHPWDAVHSQAHWGSWAVLHPA
jgi:SAM-dependent methyltransferase